MRAWFTEIVGRAPAGAELASWSKQLASTPPRVVAVSLQQQTESQAFLLRALAKTHGVSIPEAHVNAFLAGAAQRFGVRRDARVFVASLFGAPPAAPEKPEALVSRVHELVLGRPASAVEQQGWSLTIGELSLPYLAHLLMVSDEGVVALCKKLHQEILGRPPRSEELTALFARVRAGEKEEQLAASLFASDEYALQRGVGTPAIKPKAPPVDASAASH